MKKYIIAAIAVLAALFTSCVKDAVYPYASISKVEATTPVGPEAITVTATVAALVDVTVNLIYSVNGGAEQTVPMTGSKDTYTGVIPGQPVGSVIKYRVEATTAEGTNSLDGKDITVAEKPAEPQTLFINEVDCGNKKFEIYNASAKAVDIAGYVFQTDGGSDWTVPAGKGNIPAKGYLVFTAKNADINEGPSFGISGTKGFKLTMLKEGEVVDEIDNSAGTDGFQTVEDGWTLSRKTDGAAEWVLVEGGTIGYSNGAEPVDDGKVVFNEVDCTNKQFEIYNGMRKEVDISGYVIKKDDGNDWAIPAGKGVIPAKGYLVFTAKNPDINEGPGFGISGTKGFKLTLYEADGTTLVDEIDNSATVDAFKVVADGETLGRKTDGADEWVLFSAGTIGESNNNGTIKE